MATDISKLQSEFTKILMKAGKLGLNGAKPAYDALVKAYKEVIAGEDMVIKALPDARKNGVTGNDIKDFLRDPAFKKVFKAYDKLVDELDKAEKVCYAMSYDGNDVITEFKTLEEKIKKEYKGSTDKAIVGLLKDIEKRSKAYAVSAGVYDITIDKKMHFYATKFKTKVEALLALAPKSETPDVELPKELSGPAIEAALKQAKKSTKELEGISKKISSTIKAIDPFTRKGDLMVQKEVNAMEAIVKKLKAVLDTYEDLVKSNTKEIKRGHETVDITAFMKRLDAETDAADKQWKESAKEHADAKKAMENAAKA